MLIFCVKKFILQKEYKILYYSKTIETVEVKFLKKEFLKDVFEFRQLCRIVNHVVVLLSHKLFRNIELTGQPVDKVIASFSLITVLRTFSKTC